MKLMTKEIENKLLKHPLYSTEGNLDDAEVIVRYFNPYGSEKWLIIEGEKVDGDFWLYGLCYIYTWEWGEVPLSQLEQVGFIERDKFSHGKVRDLADGYEGTLF